jgi:hypothetical protein
VSALIELTATEIHAEHEAAQRCARDAVAHAIRAGELLLEAKAALPHGAFGAWLRANVEFSDRTAQGYMRLAKLDDEKRNGVADLSLRQALTALSEPRELDEAPATVLPEDIAAMSREDRVALRRRCLETAARAMQDILDRRDIPSATDIPLEAVSDCERMLIGICAASPPGQLPLGMMLTMQCHEIRAMLREATP